MKAKKLFSLAALLALCGCGSDVHGDGPESPCDGCAVQPPRCGDGTCNGHETAASCPDDCEQPEPFCGDGRCDPDETHASCAGDCLDPRTRRCGDGICASTESAASCPDDCGGGAIVCDKGMVPEPDGCDLGFEPGCACR